MDMPTGDDGVTNETEEFVFLRAMGKPWLSWFWLILIVVIAPFPPVIIVGYLSLYFPFLGHFQPTPRELQEMPNAFAICFLICGGLLCICFLAYLRAGERIVVNSQRLLLKRGSSTVLDIAFSEISSVDVGKYYIKLRSPKGKLRLNTGIPGFTRLRGLLEERVPALKEKIYGGMEELELPLTVRLWKPQGDGIEAMFGLLLPFFYLVGSLHSHKAAASSVGIACVIFLPRLYRGMRRIFGPQRYDFGKGGFFVYSGRGKLLRECPIETIRDVRLGENEFWLRTELILITDHGEFILDKTASCPLEQLFHILHEAYLIGTAM